MLAKYGSILLQSIGFAWSSFVLVWFYYTMIPVIVKYSKSTHNIGVYQDGPIQRVWV
jgi:hypothetical protein